jgi:hypothetical protein
MDLLPVTTVGFPSLRARMTPDDARLALSGSRVRPLHAAGMLRRSALRSMAAVYVPYHLFRVTMADAGQQESSYFAIDAVTGTLDVYRFDRVPDLDVIESRNRIPARLSSNEAWPLLAAKVQRAIFQTGFFKLRDPRMSGTIERTDLHIPYWVGFYQNGGNVRLRVLDGVRCRFEGGKARALFEEWLTQSESRSPKLE